MLTIQYATKEMFFNNQVNMNKQRNYLNQFKVITMLELQN